MIKFSFVQLFFRLFRSLVGGIFLFIAFLMYFHH